MFHLVVTRAFGQYRPGDQITDPSEIAAARKDYAANVVQVFPTEASPADVAPAPKARKSS